MNNKDNPYGAAPYDTVVQFGDRPQEQPASAATAMSTPRQAPADAVKDTTTAAFAADVIAESRNQPVLVDFWAPWCGPCKQLGPSLEKAVRESGGRVKLVKMNIDEHPSIAGQLGIQSIPAVIAFKDGQPVDGFVGAVPESQIREFIAKLGGQEEGAAIESTLAAAADARHGGDPDTAASMYSSILEQAPDNADAIAGLADLTLEAGDVEQASRIVATVPAAQIDHPAVASVRARIALAEQTAALGDPAELERRLAADPKDHQARFELAVILNGHGERMRAADELLAIVKADRAWNENAARAQLIQFFEAWGATDEATLAARRKLSSLLFS